ncbi:dolichyl-phosphate-mannose--protein mannosyltransferase, partial [Parabacteroides sp. OttesenSCG-928-G21]|nr:dolichyl-phosphate-mannose--protein mannosyltransferase [Parabacteroides sp. OttesenSCG-928-G21]
NNNIYVMNYLKEYRNLYGLNFYLGNKFNNFELENPSNGYFLCAEEDMEKVIRKYDNQYSFNKLEVSEWAIREVRQKIAFYSFTKK